jgi:hypothetical protein
MTLWFSRELADDEGVVFVAYAPPCPRLVLGRRDPRNGELCVSRILRKPPGMPWPDPNDPKAPPCEHITEPEAKRLFDEIERWMAKGAPGGDWLNRNRDAVGCGMGTGQA